MSSSIRIVPGSAMSLLFASETMTRIAAWLPARYSVWPEDVHDGPAKNLRDGLDALDRRSLVVGILEAVAETLPDDVFEAEGASPA